MNLKILLASFALVFVAELGDKTQLTALAFCSTSRSPWSVFLGTFSNTVIAVPLGLIKRTSTSRARPCWMST